MHSNDKLYAMQSDRVGTVCTNNFNNNTPKKQISHKFNDKITELHPPQAKRQVWNYLPATLKSILYERDCVC